MILYPTSVDTRVDTRARRAKQEKAVASATVVQLGSKPLKTTYCAELLGRLLQGDGGFEQDLERRTCMARSRFN